MTHPEPSSDARQRMQPLVRAIGRLPSPPFPLAADSPEIVRAGISRFIASDQSLAQRFLARAGVLGSAPPDAARLEEALARFETPQLLGLALERFIARTLFEKSAQDDSIVARLRAHSLACAVAAQLLAERSAPALAGESFTCGLLHDCGKALLFHLDPERYARILQAPSRAGSDAKALEAANFGADHAAAGKLLLESWHAPSLLVEAAWLHHRKPAVIRDALTGSAVLGFIALGDHVARLVMSEAFPQKDSGHAAHLASELGIGSDVVQDVSRRLADRYCSMADLLDLDQDVSAFYRASLKRAHRVIANIQRECHARSEEPEISPRLLDIVGSLGSCLASVGSRSEMFDQIRACIVGLLPESLGAVAVSTGDGGRFEGLAWDGDKADRLSILSGQATPPATLGPRLDALIGHGLALDASPEPRDPEGRREHFADSGYAALLSLDAESRLLFCIGFAARRPLPRHDRVVWSLRQVGDMAQAHLGRLKTLDDLTRRSGALSTALARLEKAKGRSLRSERLAAIGHAAAGTAQEINNPLSIISARTQLLERQESDPQKKRSLRQMLTQVERITDTLQNLMDFARPPLPVLEKTSLNLLASECLALVRDGNAGSGVPIAADLAHDLPEIPLDRSQMKRLVFNLLLNALSAVEDKGSGEILVTTRLGLKGRRILLSVRDTGLGIPRDALARIFDPFFTTHCDKTSLGLGLSVCHAIAQNHQGSLEVKSREGEWTEFTLVLPVSTPQERPDHGPAVSPDSALSSPAALCDVLIADPDPVMRDALALALEQSGFQVDAVDDASAALEFLSRFEYRLAVLDLEMGVSDVSLVATARKTFPEMMVVALVDTNGTPRIPEAMALGVRACARKPLHVAGLAERIGRLLHAGKTE